MKSIKAIRLFMIGILAIIVIGIIFKASIIVDAKKSGKTIYEITVNSFNQNQTYTTTEYTRDKESGCIIFKDEIGIKHVVCNNYNITEY
jgi:CDP-diacylglycerol pyrophosphatase